MVGHSEIRSSPTGTGRSVYLCTRPQQAKATDSVFASESAYIAGVEKAYALTGVSGDDYEGEEDLTREKIEAELARRDVWRDLGEVRWRHFGWGWHDMV